MMVLESISGNNMKIEGDPTVTVMTVTGIVTLTVTVSLKVTLTVIVKLKVS